jgi:hypothetical protein
MCPSLLDACETLSHNLYALHISFWPCAVVIEFAAEYILVSGSYRTLLADLTHRWACTVQDTADQYLRDRRLPPVMQAVIGGKFAQQIICRGVPYRSEKEEEFYQVLLICAAVQHSWGSADDLMPWVNFSMKLQDTMYTRMTKSVRLCQISAWCMHCGWVA